MESIYLIRTGLSQTLIYPSLDKVDHILQIMNSIDNNIEFTHEIENNGVLSFIDTLVSRTDKDFSVVVFRYFSTTPCTF